jgi:hypothetical protein
MRAAVEPSERLDHGVDASAFGRVDLHVRVVVGDAGSPTAFLLASHVASAAESLWTAKWNTCFAWFVQKSPILLPPNATIEEMSSAFAVVLPALTPLTAGTKAAPQVLSSFSEHVAALQRVRLTQTCVPWRHVAQSWPVESLSMTRVSPRSY